jgi:hypothetical protein
MYEYLGMTWLLTKGRKITSLVTEELPGLTRYLFSSTGLLLYHLNLTFKTPLSHIPMMLTNEELLLPDLPV